MVTESCSESQMRSRTSRGVPEWSGGKDFNMGSYHTVAGKVRGHTGIVPGPPEGFRGSIGRGHLSRRASWAVVGWEPALRGLGASPLGPMRLGLGGNPRGGAPLLGGQATPLSRRPPSRSHLEGAGPLPPPPINRGARGGLHTHLQGAAPPLPNTSPPPS